MGKRLLFSASALVALLLATPVFAAPAGFVPASGVWFSQDVFFVGDTVKIQTVVVNNSYERLEGSVGFYDNSTLIGSVPVSIALDEAKQVSLPWQPAEGDH